MLSLRNKESARPCTLGSKHGCSPSSQRTVPLCILLAFERKHVCWEAASTLDLAVIPIRCHLRREWSTWPVFQGGSEECILSHPAFCTTALHRHFTCDLRVTVFLQDIHCYLIVYWATLLARSIFFAGCVYAGWLGLC